MIEYKQNTAARVPVRLFNSITGLPETGVPFGSVSVTVEDAAGSLTNFSPTAPDWEEKTTGAFSGQGKYTLVLPSTLLASAGPLTYAVAAAATKGYIGFVKVIANEEAETNVAVLRVLDLTEGRWKVDKVAKQLILYKPDGVTLLRRFNLYNDVGSPDVDIVFDKVPV